MPPKNARQVREEISTEQWQRLNRMYYRVTGQVPAVGTGMDEFPAAILDDSTFSGRDRHDHEPWRGLALHPDWQVHRTGILHRYIAACL